MQNSFNKFYFKSIHPKKKKKKRRNAKKVSSILIAFFNLEIPLGYTKVALRKTSQYNERHERENVEIVGIVKSAGHRGEQLYNPNLSRDFRPLICFLASRNRNRGYLLRANDRSSYEFRGNIFDNAVASRFAPFLHRLSLYWIKENKVEPSPRTRVRNKN